MESVINSMGMVRQIVGTYSLRALFVVIAAIGAGFFIWRLSSQGALYSYDRHVIGAMKRSSLELSEYLFFGDGQRSLNRVNMNGEVLSSWRFQVLQQSEATSYRGANFASAWFAPDNADLAARSHPLYCFGRYGIGTSAETNVMAVCGTGTIIDLASKVDRPSVDDDTILLVEVVGSATHWMEPGDFDIDLLKEGTATNARLGGQTSTSFHVAFADGKIWTLRSSIPNETLRAFCTVDGARQLRREDALAPYRVLINPAEVE